LIGVPSISAVGAQEEFYFAVSERKDAFEAEGGAGVAAACAGLKQRDISVRGVKTGGNAGINLVVLVGVHQRVVNAGFHGQVFRKPVFIGAVEGGATSGAQGVVAGEAATCAKCDGAGADGGFLGNGG